MVPKFVVFFMVLLENKIQFERQIAIKDGDFHKYRKKWTILCIFDEYRCS